MNPRRPTKAERRRIGRAIRKQRRETAAAVATYQAIDWPALGAFILDTFEQWGRAVGHFIDAATDAISAARGQIAAALQTNARRAAWERAETARAHRDWMLTHRALTKGPHHD